MRAAVGAHFLLALVMLAGRAHAVVTRAEHSRECVMCHITWGDNYNELEKDLAPPRYDVIVDGLQERNSSEEMCWSCHDGFVLDDRESFEGPDAHLKVLPSAHAHGELPLDRKGEMYCGTCHTPHSHKMGRKFSFSPFLRTAALDSRLCLECHADHQGGGSNHPLHATVGKGLGQDLVRPNAPAGKVECLSCHDMHRHQPVRRSQGKDRTLLCASCHPGSLAVQGTDHDLRTMDSALPGATGVPLREGDACAACHAMHDPPAAGSVSAGAQGRDGQCLGCHSPAGVGAAKSHREWGHPLGDAARPIKAPTGMPLDKGKVVCATCHNPHRWSSDGAAPATSGVEGDGSTSFLRRPDVGAGALCAACHAGEAAVLSSSHGPQDSLFVKSMGNHSWGCGSCHVIHGDIGFQRQQAGMGQESAATRLCLSCHAGKGVLGGQVPGVGEHSHPVGVPFPAGGKPLWLAGKDGAEAFDFEGDKGKVGCESCHDPHRWSPTGQPWVKGTKGGPDGLFLRCGPDGDRLCQGCHADKAGMAAGKHAFTGDGAKPSPSGLCGSCHQPHQAGAPPLLARSLTLTNLDSLLRVSDWAAGSPERQGNMWQGEVRACLSCHHSSRSGQKVPEAWTHPQHLGTLRPDERTGKLEREIVRCSTCHDPHQGPSERNPGAPVDFLAGSSREQVCADCHREDALSKYRYFHDRRRRR